MEKRVITSDILLNDGIKHGFFTRLGGVSQGEYASLNVSHGGADDERHVFANRNVCKEIIADASYDLVLVNQCHTSHVLILDNESYQDQRARLSPCDAIVTRLRGILIGVMTADCCPILLCDSRHGIIGACHAGWRGALSGVLENTVHAMSEIGAHVNDMYAVLGPTISSVSYEVGYDFIETFKSHMKEGEIVFIKEEGDRFYFDLPGYVMHRLRQAGVAEVSWVGHDTYAEHDLFFSYRYASHVYEDGFKGQTGRQLSCIALTR